jgi:hypothetical protein
MNLKPAWVHSAFQANLGFAVRPSLKQMNKQKEMNGAKLTQSMVTASVVDLFIEKYILCISTVLLFQRNRSPTLRTCTVQWGRLIANSSHLITTINYSFCENLYWWPFWGIQGQLKLSWEEYVEADWTKGEGKTVLHRVSSMCQDSEVGRALCVLEP